MLVAGIVVLIVASFWHSYVGRCMKMSELARPMVFYKYGRLLQLGWFLLLVIGITLVFIANWIYGLIALFIYWFVLSLVTAYIVRKTILKP